MRSNSRAAALAFCAGLALPAPAAAWDFPGHRIVGAIADLVLQYHEPATRERVSDLLEIKLPDGTVQKRSLRDVAVFPDCAKKNNERYCGRPPSDEEKAYAARNPNHSSYHYTDVPIEQRQYVGGSAGTADNDVVHMIEYAVAQLRGKAPPAIRDVSLTDTEALWLLAHLVGDIHQPLHVGAKYFDKTCEKGVDPNEVGAGQPKFGIGTTVAETVGGNLIMLVAPAPAVPPADNLHLYWDGDAVVQAMRAENLAGDEQDFARLLAAAPPDGWQTAGAPESFATQWATEILPLARQAHDRLTISKRAKPAPLGGCTWETGLDAAYEQFTSQNARAQLAKAGFRLAALLKAIFAP